MGTQNPSHDRQEMNPKAAKAYGYLIALVILLGVVFWKACGSHPKPVKGSRHAPVVGSDRG